MATAPRLTPETLSSSSRRAVSLMSMSKVKRILLLSHQFPVPDWGGECYMWLVPSPSVSIAVSWLVSPDYATDAGYQWCSRILLPLRSLELCPVGFQVTVQVGFMQDQQVGAAKEQTNCCLSVPALASGLPDSYKKDCAEIKGWVLQKDLLNEKLRKGLYRQKEQFSKLWGHQNARWPWTAKPWGWGLGLGPGTQEGSLRAPGSMQLLVGSSLFPTSNRDFIWVFKNNLYFLKASKCITGNLKTQEAKNKVIHNHKQLSSTCSSRSLRAHTTSACMCLS